MQKVLGEHQPPRKTHHKIKAEPQLRIPLVLHHIPPVVDLREKIVVLTRRQLRAKRIVVTNRVATRINIMLIINLHHANIKVKETAATASKFNKI